MTLKRGKGGRLTPEVARAIRPDQPFKRHGLYAAAPDEARQQAEETIWADYPHLSKRDAPRVKSLAALDVLCELGWTFFLSGGKRLAVSTRSGKTITWNPGLTKLLSLEKARMDLARELLVTPRARADATPEEPDDELTRLRRKAKSEYPAGTL